LSIEVPTFIKDMLYRNMENKQRQHTHARPLLLIDSLYEIKKSLVRVVLLPRYTLHRTTMTISKGY